MKILITGGFGYLGGRLAKYLATNSQYEIILGSRHSLKAPEWLPQAKVIHTNWDTETSLLEICNGIDVIIHLAGMNAQDCSKDPAAALEVNGTATAHLVRAAISKKVKRFIYMSTAHVYTAPLAGEITEEMCPLNLHSYATSHRAGEDVVLAAHLKKEIEGVVIRLSNTYGAPTDIAVNCWMLLVNDLCHQAVKNQSMTLHSSGIQRRDFITLTDACRAIEHLLVLPVDKLEDGLFNVGGMWTPTVLEMTELIAERVLVLTGSKPKISHKESMPNEKDLFLDYKISKLIKTGFSLSNKTLINQELDQLINFCIAHFKESR